MENGSATPLIKEHFRAAYLSQGNAVAAIRDAQTYLNEDGYDFNLLMDLKSSNGERVVNKAAAGFGLKGIPTKLIIDKQGVIRFNVVGDSKGGDDEFLKNMQAMIDLAKENS